MIFRSLFLLVLVSCAAKAPPATIWPSEPPPLEPPTLAVVSPPADELTTVAPYLTGHRAPFTDDACQATGRGIVLPESKATELYQEAELGAWWEARALAGFDARLTDRAYADQVVARQALELDQLGREAVWVRWAVPVAMTAGVFLGAGAIELADRVVAP